MEGFLLKRGAIGAIGKNKWRRRWFCVRGDIILYFASQPDEAVEEEALGCIAVNEMLQVWTANGHSFVTLNNITRWLSCLRRRGNSIWCANEEDGLSKQNQTMASWAGLSFFLVKLEAWDKNCFRSRDSSRKRATSSTNPWRRASFARSIQRWRKRNSKAKKKKSLFEIIIRFTTSRASSKQWMWNLLVAKSIWAKLFRSVVSHCPMWRRRFLSTWRMEGCITWNCHWRILIEHVRRGRQNGRKSIMYIIFCISSEGLCCVFSSSFCFSMAVSLE